MMVVGCYKATNLLCPVKQLPIEKGIITEEEFYRKLKVFRGSMRGGGRERGSVTT